MPKDEKQKVIENNPCGMCRAFGLPSCRGHGSGSGIGDNTLVATKNDMASKTPSLPFELKKSPDVKLKELMAQSEGWSFMEDDEFICEFSNPLALMSLILNLETGSIKFKANKDLSKEEQQILKQVFDTIGQELNLFKNELLQKNEPIDVIKVQREDNKLSIKISNPKYYNVFIQRLMDKNLLPTPSIAPQQKEFREDNKDHAEPDAQKKSTAPNPFDIFNFNPYK